MRNSARSALIAVSVLLTLFAVALARSILLRAQTTYNYPAYSSLNNSGTGTKAYCDTLARLGLAVSRNYKPLDKLQGRQAAIIYAGVESNGFRYSEEADFHGFERLARGGARLVIALTPAGTIDVPSAKPKKFPPPNVKPSRDNLKKLWGIELTTADRKVPPETRAFLGSLELRPIDWRFGAWPKEWSASQPRGGSPLFLERTFDRGAILLVADDKVFTNEELLASPDTDVLAAVPGAYRAIVFDENHLGLQDTGTVLGLLIANRLEWILVGFAVLAALYIWRASAGFLPCADPVADSAISGRDAHLALTNLLMQSVPARSLLRTCAEEWNTCGHLHGRPARHSFNRAEFERLDRVSTGHAVSEYRNLAHTIKYWFRSGAAS